MEVPRNERFQSGVRQAAGIHRSTVLREQQRPGVICTDDIIGMLVIRRWMRAGAQALNAMEKQRSSESAQPDHGSRTSTLNVPGTTGFQGCGFSGVAGGGGP